MSTLEQDLNHLAAALGVDAGELLAYAAEDTIGGYHPDPTQSKFPSGSLWAVEGQVIYALCRCLKPKHVIEVGTFYGASAVHILSALKRNGSGHLTAIDIAENAGSMIPDDLRPWCTQVAARGQEAIPTLEDAQIVFEDASHTTDDVEQILRAALEHARPRIILSHDAEHFLQGGTVRAGWTRVFGDDFRTFKTAPSDCGLAYKVF